MLVYIGAMLVENLYEESPRRVLGMVAENIHRTDLALCIVKATDGGAVRARGALMLASPSGDRIGYFSGGCIDEDIARHAATCLTTGKTRELVYGARSDVIDLPLPCGGTIEVLIVICKKAAPPTGFVEALEARCPLGLVATLERLNVELPSEHQLDDIFYEPDIRLRIAGRGADALALARQANLLNFDVTLQLVDETDQMIARRDGIEVELLRGLSDLGKSGDDSWTAFILAFHDLDWEIALLADALQGPAFFIGAIGSKRTQERRRRGLAKLGFSGAEIGRISGPVGLVPSQRDASKLALSALAEVLSAWNAEELRIARSTAIVLPAAGAGSRFEDGDELLADLHEKTVLEASAQPRICR